MAWQVCCSLRQCVSVDAPHLLVLGRSEFRFSFCTFCHRTQRWLAAIGIAVQNMAAQDVDGLNNCHSATQVQRRFNSATYQVMMVLGLEISCSCLFHDRGSWFVLRTARQGRCPGHMSGSPGVLLGSFHSLFPQKKMATGAFLHRVAIFLLVCCMCLNLLFGNPSFLVRLVLVESSGRHQQSPCVPASANLLSCGRLDAHPTTVRAEL